MQAGTSLAGGRYIIEQRLKRTGMADLWLAKTKTGGFSRPVVIKMIHPDLSEQQDARARFFDEARLASQIAHPNVVQVFDYGEDLGVLFLAMEYIEGFDMEVLLTRCREGYQALPIPVVCRMIADAAQGLDYVHTLRDSQGQPLELVHRDISPHNLIVDTSGVVKIIDFGIVKARSKASKTRTGVIVGKLQYMSPEQLSSEELDARSDIFSLGLVFFELITLQPRFRGKNLIELFYEIQNPIPDLYALRPDCPPEIVHALQRALAPQRNDRYQRAYELSQALESWLYHSGHVTTPLHVADTLESLFSETSSSTQVGPGFLLGSEETQMGNEPTFFGQIPIPPPPAPPEMSIHSASNYSDPGPTFSEPQAVSQAIREAYAKASYNAPSPPPSTAPPPSASKAKSLPPETHTLAQFKVQYPVDMPDQVEVNSLIDIDEEEEGETRLLPSKEEAKKQARRPLPDAESFLQASYEGDEDAATNLLRPKSHPLLPRHPEEAARPTHLPAAAYAPPPKPSIPEPSLPSSNYPSSGPLPLVPLQLSSSPPPSQQTPPPQVPPSPQAPHSGPPPRPPAPKKTTLFLWAVLGILAFLIGLALVLLLASPGE